MKKLYFLLLSFSIFANGQTYVNNTQIDIPNDDEYGTSSVINVPLTGNIGDPSKVTVSMSIDHTWVGDLTVALVTPGGPETGPIALFKKIGTSDVGSSSPLIPENIIGFNSAATEEMPLPSNSSIPIPAGIYLPTVGVSAEPYQFTKADLNVMFNGISPTGDWKLLLFDTWVIDVGTLDMWEIKFDEGALGTNEQTILTPYIALFGNPVKDVAHLKINTTRFSEMTLQIFDLSGKIVWNQNVSTGNTMLDINVSHLAPGNYLIVPTVDGVRKGSIKMIKK